MSRRKNATAVYRFLGGLAWVEEQEDGKFQVFFTFDFVHEHQLGLPCPEAVTAESLLLRSDRNLVRHGGWGDVPLYWGRRDNEALVVVKEGDEECRQPIPARSVQTGTKLNPHAVAFFRFLEGPTSVDENNRLR